MRQFFASTVEQRKTFSSDFQTHPMEGGWASEAIFFIVIEEVSGGVMLDASVEISFDGVTWVGEGTRFEPINATGTYFVRVRHFGNWLRINARLEGGGAINLSVHLHLKE